MDTLLRDIRYACVTMRRNAAFATAGLITLALGIGATTAVFSVVYGVLLRPLPYPEASRIVALSEEHSGAVSPLQVPMLSNLTYYAWSEHAQTIDAFAAYRGQVVTMTLPGGSARITGTVVTPSLFPLVGASPARGRFFRDDEASPGSWNVMVLSDRLWREHFRSDAGVVGRGIIVDGEAYTVIGVARPEFAFPNPDARFWTPLAPRRPSPDAVAGGHGQMSVFNVLARLRPGATKEAAEAEGTAAARSTVRPMAAMLLFGNGGPPVVHVHGLVDEMTSSVRPALLVLLAAVLCLLLIACANVSSMLLSRGVARQRELTIRAAIGASRGRLARQLLTESLVLSTAGAILGVALARTLIGFVPLLASTSFPRLDSIAIDARALGVAAASAMLAALVSGLAPATRASRVDLVDSLHGGDGAAAGGYRDMRAARLRDALLAGEAAVAVILIVGAMLMARSFVRLTQVDAGYTADRVLATEVFVPGGDAEDRAQAMNALVASLVDRLRVTPGVVAAGIGNMAPLDNATMIAGFQAPWAPEGVTKPRVRAVSYVVTPGYAEALGLRLRAGRFFTDRDLAGGVIPWIVNEEFARLYVPPQPIGFEWQRGPSGDGLIPARTHEIIGVVRNVLKNGNDTRPQPEMFHLARDEQRFHGRLEIAIKTAGDPSTLAPVVRRLVTDAAPEAAVETVPLAQKVAASVAQPRFAMLVLLTFAGLAVVLASVGLYGVLAYGVAQRRRELGVRAALGASRRTLVALVMRHGLATVGLGLIVGLGGAAALTRFMRSALFGIAPLDAISFAMAPIVLCLVAVVACLVPARRAASTDPAEALRCE
jgi:putative ABC transport system permease protein